MTVGTLKTNEQVGSFKEEKFRNLNLSIRAKGVQGVEGTDFGSGTREGKGRGGGFGPILKARKAEVVVAEFAVDFTYMLLYVKLKYSISEM